MADVLTTFAQVSNDAPNVYVAQQMYTLAERYLKVLKYASRYTLPQRYGKTIRVDRVKRLALPVAPLTEGVPPSAAGLTVENVDVTVDQWGIVAFLTDLGLITTKHPMLAKAIDRTALAIAETIEREACVMLLGGTSVIYTSATQARVNIVKTDVVNTAQVLAATTQLRALGAPAFDGDLMAGVMSPQVEADVLKTDTVFQAAHVNMNVRAQEYGELGTWAGVRWTRGNFLPMYLGVIAPVTTAPTAIAAGNLAITTGPYTSGVTLAGGIIVVARDINSDYERKISLPNTTFALTANTGFSMTMPTSANYTYDVYIPPVIAGTGTPVLAASRLAANAVFTTVGMAIPTSTQVAPANPASTIEVFVTFIFGRDAFGRVELDGMSLQSYITPSGASFSNPLAQGRKVGSKISWKSFILDNSFFLRIESGSFFSAQLPA